MVVGWATLRAHRSTVRTLGFSPTGQHLVSGDDEGWTVFWSLETRRPLAIWYAHDNALLTTQFWKAPNETDGELVVTHGRDNKLRIWRNPQDSNQIYNTQPLPPGNAIESVTESAKYPKPWLVYTQDVNAMNFCSIALAPPTLEHPLVFAVPSTVASERIDVYNLTPNFELSRRFKELNAAEDLPLQTHIEDEDAQQQKRGQLGTVMALQYCNIALVAGYESGHVAVFDKESGAVLCLAQPHKSPVLSLTAIVGDDGTLEVWTTAADHNIFSVNTSNGEIHQLTKLEHRGVASIDVCRAMNLAVTAGWDGSVRLFNASTFSEEESFTGGRLMGITTARISTLVPETERRRLRRLPRGCIAVAGKDSRIGLNAIEPVKQIEE